MRNRDIAKLGIPKGPCVALARKAIVNAGLSRDAIAETLASLAINPENYLTDQNFSELAKSVEEVLRALGSFVERESPAAYQSWGSDFEPMAVKQMKNACRLPVSVKGALMPDAHVGYGLPIGGVLATRNAVIPFAVGMDIACRMRMTVLDLPVSTLTDESDRLKSSLEKSTRFGIGSGFKGADKHEHAVMDEDWTLSPVTLKNKSKAWSQLGSSGSGNHFVEFGTLTLSKSDLGLEAGEYLAVLSHSGSRGTGAEVAKYYSAQAQEQHPELPPDLMALAWLDLDSELGQEYWVAMELMGRYAAASHELIHRGITSFLGSEPLAEVENHHNFAWRETHGGEEVVVHRKGATPASCDALGIIPGSMATPGYVVRGKGNLASLNSASHGAGRQMSRTKAKQQFSWGDLNAFLEAQGVTLIAAGLDEIPMAYKDIDSVMAAQSDLVEQIARFDPKLVRMASTKEG